VDLHITFEGRRDLSGQIYRQIRAAILDGRLRGEQALPPTRELARRLEVSRNTVSVAYDRLMADGFLTGRVGAGTFVSHGLHPYQPESPPPAAGPLQPRAVWADIPEPPDLATEPAYDFRAGTPDARLFPYQTWRRLMTHELRPSAVRTGMPGAPAGHSDLRAAIARHIGVSRAVRATPDDVLVTNGIQQAIDMIARVLVEPGTCVAVENPGYPPVRRLFESLNARVVGVPVDADGLVVDAIPAEARMVYVTPSHQFPLGTAMSLSRRIALVAWAHRCGGVVIEDDYDSEFRYGGRPIEPLQNLDHTGRVLYVGSFSKTMLPTLRLGFLVAPPSLRRPLRVARFVSDWHTALPSQAALARFIDDGTLARHLRKMRNEYRVRHERIAEILERDFGAWLDLVPSAAGLHLSAYSKDRTAGEIVDLVAAAAADGVVVYALSQFTREETERPGIMLGYGAIALGDIDEGLRRLRRCFLASSVR
jgi:GntR family transcriptional regulator/MocR family aminotransferase